MIKAIQTDINKLVTASYELSKLDRYICPMCKGEMILCKGMQDNKVSEGIVKYYMYPLVNEKFRVDNWEYSFKVYDEWYKIRLGSIKVVR